MELLSNRVKTFCLTQGLARTYWIAYSGGLDSHALLHVCAELRKHYPVSIKAVYIHHGLSPHAGAWAEHCQAICHELHIDFLVKKISLANNQGESPEALARESRYNALSELLDTDDVLLTAHHQDDQAETVLLQLMRGSGPKGLAAMPTIKSFAKGFHGRPLLTCSRKEIESYAHHHELRWIEDESNLNIDFSRNFLRHDVMPLLKNRWPSVANTLSRVAEYCAEAESLIDAIVESHLVSCQCGSGISISALLTLSPAMQRHVLRGWFSRLQFPMPSAVKMQQIQESCLQAAQDKSPHITWSHVEVRRYKDILYVMKRLLMHDQTKVYEWDMTQDLCLPNVGVLQAVKTDGCGLKVDANTVIIRFRQGGEYCRLPGREFHHDLKKLFQQWGVPPWERSRVPLLFVKDTLVAVVGYHIDQAYRADKGEYGRVITLF